MALSRPMYSFLGAYFEQMFNHPVRTKCITSCVIATSASYASQKIAGAKTVRKQTMLAYGLFGLIFGGTVPHYFYQLAERLIVTNTATTKALITFAMERLIYTPIFQVLSLYFLARFEGKDHRFAMQNLSNLFEKLLFANWRFLSIPVFLNINFAPPILRVLFANLIGFVWVMFISKKRSQDAEQQKRKSDAVLAAATASKSE